MHTGFFLFSELPLRGVGITGHKLECFWIQMLKFATKMLKEIKTYIGKTKYDA